MFKSTRRVVEGGGTKSLEELAWSTYGRRRQLETDRGTGRAKSSSPLVFCCRIGCRNYSRDRRRLDVSATSNWWRTVSRTGRLRRCLGWAQLLSCAIALRLLELYLPVVTPTHPGDREGGTSRISTGCLVVPSTTSQQQHGYPTMCRQLLWPELNCSLRHFHPYVSFRGRQSLTLKFTRDNKSHRLQTKGYGVVALLVRNASPSECCLIEKPTFQSWFLIFVHKIRARSGYLSIIHIPYIMQYPR